MRRAAAKAGRNKAVVVGGGVREGGAKGEGLEKCGVGGGLSFYRHPGPAVIYIYSWCYLTYYFICFDLIIAFRHLLCIM